MLTQFLPKLSRVWDNFTDFLRFCKVSGVLEILTSTVTVLSRRTFRFTRSPIIDVLHLLVKNTAQQLTHCNTRFSTCTQHIKTFTTSSLTINTNFKLHIFLTKISILPSHLNVSMYIQLYSLFTHHVALNILTINIAYGTKSIFLTFCYFLYIGRTFYDTILCSWLCETHSFKSVASSDKQTGTQALHTAILALGTMLNFVLLRGKFILLSLSFVNCTDSAVIPQPSP